MAQVRWIYILVKGEAFQLFITSHPGPPQRSFSAGPQADAEDFILEKWGDPQVWTPTCRIIPVSKWLITMVSKSPK